MANTAFQDASLALKVGVPANINLGAFCPGATSFAIVNTSAAWNQSLLTPGLSLVGSQITGTPTTAGSWLAIARAGRGTRNADASWTARSAGAYTAQRFDSATPITLGGASVANTSWDTSIKRSGAGSMKQFLLANAATNDSSKWFHSTKVSQQYSGSPPAFASNTGFGLGERFFVQFQYRPDRNFVQWPWPTTPKIYILDMLPWSSNLNLGPTANAWEIVMIQKNGYFYGYQNGPGGGFAGPPGAQDNEGWQTGVGGGGEIVFQPGIQNTARALNGSNPGLPSGAGTTWTANQQMRARYGYLYQLYDSLGGPDGLTDLLAGGVPMSIDQWHTVLLEVRVDTAYGAGNGLVRVKVAPDGQDYVTIYDHLYQTNITNPSSPFFHRDASSGGFTDQDTVFPGMGFINLAFGASMTGKPYTSFNIDEIICSANTIPAPDVGDGTGNWRTTDALLTFKVAP